MMEPMAIEVQNVSMHFNMNKEKLENLKEYFIKFLKRDLRYEKFAALENVSFQVAKGDVFGIVGLNGSGKSTLLKVISGILKPTSGRVITRGQIAPLIELGAGFDMELTARENIFLNGSVLGYSKKYMQERFDQIVEFSEMQDFPRHADEELFLRYGCTSGICYCHHDNTRYFNCRRDFSSGRFSLSGKM